MITRSSTKQRLKRTHAHRETRRDSSLSPLALDLVSNSLFARLALSRAAQGPAVSEDAMAEEEIDKHVLRKYEVLQKLGKGVSS